MANCAQFTLFQCVPFSTVYICSVGYLLVFFWSPEVVHNPFHSIFSTSCRSSVSLLKCCFAHCILGKAAGLCLLWFPSASWLYDAYIMQQIYKATLLPQHQKWINLIQLIIDRLSKILCSKNMTDKKNPDEQMFRWFHHWFIRWSA